MVFCGVLIGIESVVVSEAVAATGSEELVLGLALLGSKKHVCFLLFDRGAGPRTHSNTSPTLISDFAAAVKYISSSSIFKNPNK